MPRSYRDAVLSFLNEHPETEGDPEAIAASVGCSVSTAYRHTRDWRATRHIAWAEDAVLERLGGCDGCEHVALCRWLDAQSLPLLCERVTEDDLVLAELQGLDGALEAARV